MAIFRDLFADWRREFAAGRNGNGEAREVVFNPSAPYPFGNGGWSDYNGLGQASAGISLAGDRALSGSAAVYACVRLRAETVGSLPLHTFKRVDERRRERIKAGSGRSQRLSKLLNEAPNPEMSAQTFKQTVVTHRDLWGNSYVEVVRGPDGWPKELWPLHPDRVQVVRDPDIVGYPKVYIYSHPDGRRIRLDESRVMHIPDMTTDGLTGVSRITVLREAIGTARAAEMHAGRTWRNGAMPGSIVTIPKTQAAGGDVQEKFKARVAMYREALNGLYAGTGNAGRIAVIEEGMDWKSAGMSNKDAQFLETREFQINQIAMVFGVPPHMIGQVERSTSWGTGIEQQSIGFYTYTIQPILRSIEEGCNLRLGLVPGERTLESDGYYTEFQTQALLRGDSKAQTESLALMVQNKILSPEGAAALLNLDYDPERPTEYENPNTSAPDAEQQEEEPAPEPALDEAANARYEQLSLELAKVAGEARSAKSSVTINAPDIPAPQVNVPDQMDLRVPAPTVNVDMSPVAEAVERLEERFEDLAESLAPKRTVKRIVRDAESNIIEIVDDPVEGSDDEVAG